MTTILLILQYNESKYKRDLYKKVKKKTKDDDILFVYNNK